MGSEFDLIARYFSREHHRDDVLVGVGDDAAVLSLPPGQDLVACTDTLVEDVHFPRGTAAADLGYKALAVNLSDMAAMGAQPRWAMLALSMPCCDDAWVARFADGLYGLAGSTGVAVVGGDTVRGPLSVTVQVMGGVETGRALRRSGAAAGDAIYVTGTLGDAGLGLRALRQAIYLSGQHREFCIRHLNRPEPRVAAGLRLRGLASAAIDVSDGLVADLGHLLEASGVGAEVTLDALPLSSAMHAWFGRNGPEWALPLTAGDDYELVFTLPPGAAARLGPALEDTACQVTRIGTITARPGLSLMEAGRERLLPAGGGYDHFGGGSHG